MHKDKKWKLKMLKVNWNYQTMWSILIEVILIAFWMFDLQKIEAHILF